MEEIERHNRYTLTEWEKLLNTGKSKAVIVVGLTNPDISQAVTFLSNIRDVDAAIAVLQRCIENLHSQKGKSRLIIPPHNGHL